MRSARYRRQADVPERRRPTFGTRRLAGHAVDLKTGMTATVPASTAPIADYGALATASRRRTHDLGVSDRDHGVPACLMVWSVCCLCCHWLDVVQQWRCPGMLCATKTLIEDVEQFDVDRSLVLPFRCGAWPCGGRSRGGGHAVCLRTRVVGAAGR
jgi:hypothetical protein